MTLSLNFQNFYSRDGVLRLGTNQGFEVWDLVLLYAWFEEVRSSILQEILESRRFGKFEIIRSVPSLCQRMLVWNVKLFHRVYYYVQSAKEKLQCRPKALTESVPYYFKEYFFKQKCPLFLMLYLVMFTVLFPYKL